MANGTNDSFTSGLEEALQARESLVQDYLDRESDILSRANAERAQQTIYWEDLITQTTLQAHTLQVKSYAASARSMAKSLGAGIRTQALLMIPFEVAEATKEFARFLSTGDPLALASSLQHALAVKQYAEAAGAGGGHAGGGGGAGGGEGARKSSTPETAAAETQRTGQIIIEGARRDPNEQIMLTGEQLYQIVDGINAKWKEGSIVLDFAR